MDVNEREYGPDNTVDCEFLSIESKIDNNAFLHNITLHYIILHYNHNFYYISLLLGRKTTGSKPCSTKTKYDG